MLAVGVGSEHEIADSLRVGLPNNLDLLLIAVLIYEQFLERGPGSTTRPSDSWPKISRSRPGGAHP